MAGDNYKDTNNLMEYGQEACDLDSGIANWELRLHILYPSRSLRPVLSNRIICNDGNVLDLCTATEELNFKFLMFFK